MTAQWQHITFVIIIIIVIIILFTKDSENPISFVRTIACTQKVKKIQRNAASK